MYENGTSCNILELVIFVEMRQKLMRSSFLPLAALLLTACTATAQVRVQQYNVSTLPDNSVVYALPETHLYATVTYRKVVRQPGELALYADRYLGVRDAILEPSTSYQLVSVDLGSYGVPSDSLRFAVEMHRNSSAANVALTEDGRLVAVNVTTDIELPSLPVEKTIEAVRSKDFGDLKSLPSDYIRATTTSKRAEIAAQEIYRLRDSRTAVLSGETDQPFADGQALRIAVQGLDAAERSLTERFIGTTDTITYVRLIRPLDVVEGQQVALRFSEREGLLSSDDLRGEPIYLDTKITERAPELTERDQKKKEKQLRKGVVYVVPGSADIRLLYRGSRIAGGSFPIAQLGSLEALEGGLFTDKRMETSVRFDPATGAILKVDSRPRQ